ncbi:hypothetical protein FZEAL_8732 [Fusarium zealandicum]|uniref:Efflux pump dotC n=1 Tax=Fusarium zealandicum TaxID=1053134 RepID=A0A8H4UDA9_9HYPO|nr:hypothetical protein FZEAL_8732 [Fusarium zealandicum]
MEFSSMSQTNLEIQRPSEAPLTENTRLYKDASAYTEPQVQIPANSHGLIPESGPNNAGSAPEVPTTGLDNEAGSSEVKSKRSLAQTATVMTSLCACVFLAALEVTIVSTALPTIAAHFASDSGYTWIGTSFVLAHTASTPSWGKISDIWGRKPILLIANVIFFGGSLMCALVNDLSIFIAGRAIQGLGAAGMQTMVNICISDMFSQRDRGLYYGLMSIMWAIASGIGPLLGGAFTDRVSWRWCFWINLPITAAVFLLLIFTLKLPTPNTPVWTGLKAVDWPGSFLIIGGTLMLLLGLYLGGVYEPWNSAPVVCLIVFGIITTALFVLNEWKLAKYPVIPVHLFRAWSSAAAYAVTFFHAFVFMGVAYYLPLYFQAVLLANPLRSGIYLLPFILSITFTAAATGAYIQLTGKYLSVVHVGLVIMTLGIGLMIDLDIDLNWRKLIPFQIVSGIGVGMNFEGPLLAVQTVVPLQDVAAATTAMSFIRTIATAISIVIGGALFQNEMRGKRKMLVDGLGPELARLFDGATASASVEVIKTLPPESQLVVRKAFYQSLDTMWIMYTAFSGVGLLLGFFIRAQHLSEKHETARLGIEKKKDATHSREGVVVSKEPGEGHDLAQMTTNGNAIRLGAD